MKKLKEIIYNTLLALLVVIPVLLIAQYYLFPQESKCILIDYSDFKKDGRLYYDTAASSKSIDSLKFIIDSASKRVANFWGEKKSDPTFIYCVSDSEFKKYGDNNLDPATTHYKFGNYIVINKDGIDLNIIAHEMSHAEFKERIGYFNEVSKIPTWFDEGLAMQNDYRNYYSADSLRAVSDDLKNLPNLDSLQTVKEFWSGTQSRVRLNYMTAKYDVKQWYTKPKADSLIAALNSGKSFKEAYGQ
jgi:hypothetical protein